MKAAIPWKLTVRKQAALRETRWRHFYPGSPEKTAHRVCGDPLDTVFWVDVTVDPEGDYWGWWYAPGHGPSRDGGPDVSIIFKHRALVEVGMGHLHEAMEERGAGRIVPLRVKRVEE